MEYVLREFGAFYAWWLIGLVGAACLSWAGSRRLALRLLLLVPLAGQIAMLVYLGFTPAPSNSSLPGVLDLTYWLGFVLIYVHAVAFDGVWATFLGELGWFAIRATSLPDKFSMRFLIPAGALTGSVIGLLHMIATHTLASLGMTVPFSQWAPTWLTAAAAGGIVGGILVAYYSAQESRRGEPSLAGQCA